MGRCAARGRRLSWPTLIGLLVLIAAGIEAWALAAGRWDYSSAMPTIGDIGLLALLQLPLLACLALGIAGCLDRLRPAGPLGVGSAAKP